MEAGGSVGDGSAPDHLSARSAGDRRPQPARYCASAEEHCETTSYFMYFRHYIFIFTIYLPRVIKLKSICFESHTNFAIPSLFIYTHSKPHTHHEFIHSNRKAILSLHLEQFIIVPQE